MAANHYKAICNDCFYGCNE